MIVAVVVDAAVVNDEKFSVCCRFIPDFFFFFSLLITLYRVA